MTSKNTLANSSLVSQISGEAFITREQKKNTTQMKSTWFFGRSPCDIFPTDCLVQERFPSFIITPLEAKPFLLLRSRVRMRRCGRLRRKLKPFRTDARILRCFVIPLSTTTYSKEAPAESLLKLQSFERFSSIHVRHGIR